MRPEAMEGQDNGVQSAPSLRWRLLAGAVAWILVSVAFAGWGLNYLFTQHATRQFQEELAVHLNQLTAAFRLDETGRADLSMPLSDPRLQQPLSGLYWQIDRVSAEGATLQAGVLRSRSTWDQMLPAPSDKAGGEPDGDVFYETGSGALPALGLLARTVEVGENLQPDIRWRLIMASDRSNLTGPVAHFTGMMIIALGMLALGMAVAAVILVLGGLRPLDMLRRRLADVRAGHVVHIQGRFPSEIQPLVDEFNGVLATNAEIVQRARTQAGNLAHAVKTPLTVLENAAHEQDSPFARLVAEQTDAARRQIDWHLARARVAAAMQAGGMRTPLAPVLQALARTMRRLHADRQLDIEVSVPDELIAFCGEEQDLHEMLGNLLDNACKWAAGRVRVSGYRQENWLMLHVDDDGPGLRQEDRQAVFQRGVRLDERVPGSGLGLHIVFEMVELYQGRVVALASPLGGLRIELRLPGDWTRPCRPPAVSG